MSDETKRILEKIKKCFALSQSANANEAAVALKQAHALAKKYNLEHRIEELCQITSGRRLPAGNQKSLPLYLAQLLGLINQVFRTRSICHCERVSESQVKSFIDFYGYEHDVLISEYAWTILSQLLVKSRMQFLNAHTDGRMKKATKTRRADIYALGWIHSIYDEVKGLGREMPEDELVEHNEKIVAYQCALYNQLGTAKIKASPLDNSTAVSPKEFEAYHRGIDDGANVSLNKGVRGAKSKQNLLS